MCIRDRVNGAGTVDGEPRMGTHTWPEMNSATITIVEEEMVPLILKYVDVYKRQDHGSTGNRCIEVTRFQRPLRVPEQRR